MKKVFISFSILLALHTKAQPLPMVFTVLEESYLNLENDTIISVGNWDDGNWTVPIGFDFDYMQQTHQEVIFTGPAGGFDCELIFGPWNGNVAYDIICPALLDVKESASIEDVSNISYIIDGDAPNRIFKLQWKNCALNGDVGETMRVNFQMWLNETTNAIDFRYGPSIDFNIGATGFIGLPIYLGNNWNNSIIGNNCTGLWNMSGEPSNPDFNFAFASNDLFSDEHLNNLPPMNTVYHFDAIVNVSEIENGKLLLYPTMAMDKIKLMSNFPIQTLTIYDQQGRAVKQSTVKASNAEIEIVELKAGIYTVLCSIQSGVATKRFVKL